MAFQRLVFAVSLSLCTFASDLARADYATHPLAQAFMDKMVKEHNFKRQEVAALLRAAEKKPAILEAIARPAEKSKPWFEYRKIFLGADRIEQGVTFWSENAAALREAEQRFGVPAKMIVAIIGVETRFGRQMGSHRVIDALSTLAFDYPPRAPFFTQELEAFLVLTRSQKQNPLSLMGSYAGAMGFGQFMPSSVQNFAVDFDDDGVEDIWQNKRDAIGSVANYFKGNGWQKGAAVVTPARALPGFDAQALNTKAKPTVSLADMRNKGFVPLHNTYPANLPVEALSYAAETGTDYWLGFTNFYVITRYNRSQMYALAAWQLGEAIEAARMAPKAKQ